MGVQIESDGRRWVEVSREVAGTQEEVWGSIATGPGISAWFVPTTFDMGPNGEPERVISHFGVDDSMDSISDIKEWDPPRKFVATSADLGAEAPLVETEWAVDLLSGSTSTVRVRHSFVSDNHK